MAYLDFYDLNANRAYPFKRQEQDVDLTSGAVWRDHWILDCGFTLSSVISYDNAADYVYLESLERSGTNVTFTFAVNTIDAAGEPRARVQFTRSLSAPFGASEFVDFVSDGGVAFLVTGDLSSMSADLPNGVEVTSTYSFERLVVEPTLAVSETDFSVTAIDVYNKAAPRAPAPGDSFSAVSEEDAYRVVYGLTGDVKFKPGYNMLIDTTEDDNLMTFTPSVSAGEGEPCGFISRYSSDEEGDGQACNDLLYTINGAAGTDGRFWIEGGSGVYVENFPDEHRILITLDIDGQIECSAPTEESEDESG